MPLDKSCAKIVLENLGLENSGMTSNAKNAVGILECYRKITQNEKKEELAPKIDVLGKIVPICSFCHRIRTKDGKWHVLEVFWNEIKHAKLSHGVCPLCAKVFYDYEEP